MADNEITWWSEVANMYRTRYIREYVLLKLLYAKIRDDARHLQTLKTTLFVSIFFLYAEKDINVYEHAVPARGGMRKHISIKPVQLEIRGRNVMQFADFTVPVLPGQQNLLRPTQMNVNIRWREIIQRTVLPISSRSNFSLSRKRPVSES